MTDLQTEMNQTVTSFVSQVTELARRAALETLGVALGGKPRANGHVIRTRAFGGKRPSEEILKMASAFHEFVAKHPGLRIEQINKQLGTTTKDLALPIRKLAADGSIKTKGDKRSTTYFAIASKTNAPVAISPGAATPAKKSVSKSKSRRRSS